MKITPQKFYNLFLGEVKKSGIESIPWNNNKTWTKRLLKDKNCVMKKIADKIGLLYYSEYFKLDGIFFKKELAYRCYPQNIEIIIEHENDCRTIEREIYKLIPLFFAPLKVIITYVETDKDIQEIERIKNVIKERIKNDDPFFLHKNKIKTLLILGSHKNNKINWQGIIYRNNDFKLIKI